MPNFVPCPLRSVLIWKLPLEILELLRNIMSFPRLRCSVAMAWQSLYTVTHTRMNNKTHLFDIERLIFFGKFHGNYFFPIYCHRFETKKVPVLRWKIMTSPLGAPDFSKFLPPSTRTRSPTGREARSDIAWTLKASGVIESRYIEKLRPVATRNAAFPTQTRNARGLREFPQVLMV